MRIADHRLSNGAFSYIELLVVLAMMLILAVLGMNQLTTSARKRGMTACVGNLQKIYIAMGFYRSDNGRYPFQADATTAAEPLSQLVPKGTTDTSIFICPASHDKPVSESESLARSRVSYDYYMGRTTSDDPQEVLLSDWQVDAAPKRLGTQIFSMDGKKPGNNHGDAGGNLLTCGGAVVYSGPKAVRDVLFPPTVKLLGP